MGSSDDATDAKAFVFAIAVVELKTCRVILVALYTAELAFITPDPLP
nr:hypothetical protein [Ktedonobacteraceae bacterium]